MCVRGSEFHSFERVLLHYLTCLSLWDTPPFGTRPLRDTPHLGHAPLRPGAGLCSRAAMFLMDSSECNRMSFRLDDEVL